MYPVMLDIKGKRCLVVGGGPVAARKAEGLCREEARVRVIAPRPMAALAKLAAAGKLELKKRNFRAGDTRGFQLVFVATDDAATNRRVAEEARAAGVWVNTADDPELCTFHLPARLQRGPLQLAVASAGEAPFVVRRLRQLLERRFGSEWAEWCAAAGKFRRRVRAAGLDRARQEQAYDCFFRATVDGEKLRARLPRPDEEAAWLGRPGEGTGVCQADDSGRPGTPAPGSVTLVGAGPGEVGLLTLSGREELLQADAVVYDRLAAAALPTELPENVELHCVGKEAGHHPVAQEEINRLLIELARRGMRVVRLKGGDAYVFGRGGEEAEAMVRAGIPFRVVPGVTAGLAAAALAGIPVTFRREVVRVVLVTAHEAEKEKDQVRWELLAKDPAATIIGYMGVASLPRVARALLRNGMPADTPAAVVAEAASSRQRVAEGTLADIAEIARGEDIRPPAVFIIGPTVRHRAELDFFARQPLFGQRLAVFAGPGGLGKRLRHLGAEVVSLPLPITPAARVVLSVRPLSGCVLTKKEEVEALEEERDGPGFGPDTVAWCLSQAAADRARSLGWPQVERIGEVEQIFETLSRVRAGAGKGAFA